MQKRREMIERYYLSGVDAVEGWRCSRCRWTYDLEHPIDKSSVPFDVKYRAKEEFDRHICAEHP